jgi:hypothetical protein
MHNGCIDYITKCIALSWWSGSSNSCPIRGFKVKRFCNERNKHIPHRLSAWHKPPRNLPNLETPDRTRMQSVVPEAKPRALCQSVVPDRHRCLRITSKRSLALVLSRSLSLNSTVFSLLLFRCLSLAYPAPRGRSLSQTRFSGVVVSSDSDMLWLGTLAHSAAISIALLSLVLPGNSPSDSHALCTLGRD